MSNYATKMQSLADEYVRETGKESFTSDEVAEWAIRTGQWKPHPAAIRRQCAEDLSKAMREEYITDARGRRVRAKHVARVRRGGKQLNLWADIRSAPRSHMALAFQQRRRQIVGDCRQLKLDVDSFNEMRSAEDPIQMVFDFSQDLEEMAAIA